MRLYAVKYTPTNSLRVLEKTFIQVWFGAPRLAKRKQYYDRSVVVYCDVISYDIRDSAGEVVTYTGTVDVKGVSWPVEIKSYQNYRATVMLVG